LNVPEGPPQMMVPVRPFSKKTGKRTAAAGRPVWGGD
jgi:hypothetical protein